MASRWLSLKTSVTDALLTDNEQSLFADVGYDRVANFIREKRDINPDDNNFVPKAGGIKKFTIPQLAALIGPMDLIADLHGFEPFQSDSTANSYSVRTQRWHNRVGYAMIEKIEIMVSSHKIQTIPGDWLNLKNALMTKDEFRLTTSIGDFGDNVSLSAWNDGSSGWSAAGDNPYYDIYRNAASKHNDYSGTYAAIERRACRVSTHGEGATRLIIPTELFFTQHPSRFLKIEALTNNSVRIEVTFRPQRDYLQYFDTAGNVDHSSLSGPQQSANEEPKAQNAQDTCFLRCHLYHVPREEANQFKDTEEATLIKQIQHVPQKRFTAVASSATSPQLTETAIDFTLRGPVSEVLFTVRRVKDLSRRTTQREPDIYGNSTVTQGAIGDYGCIDRFNYLPVKRFKLKYDNDDRTNWEEAAYYMTREVPMHHSQGFIVDHVYGVFFSANPEGENPAGYDQMDKLKKGELLLELEHPTSEELQVDIYAVTYNWVEYNEGLMQLTYNY